MAGANEKDDPVVFDFLVKRTSANASMTAFLSAPPAVQISGVLGRGFTAGNLDDDDGEGYCHPATQCLLLFAAGSGIGPTKAAIESGQLNVGSDDGWKARLCYGERTESDLGFADRFEAWKAMGYEVVPVLSQPFREFVDGSGGIRAGCARGGQRGGAEPLGSTGGGHEGNVRRRQGVAAFGRCLRQACALQLLKRKVQRGVGRGRPRPTFCNPTLRSRIVH